MTRPQAAETLSVTEIVHQVLRSAERPLTFGEILAEVEQRGPLGVPNLQRTVRGTLTQAQQLVSLGDGRYGYLPHVVEGSLLRVPLTEDEPASRRLLFPVEVRHALFPSFLDIQKRRSERPARWRLADGLVVELPLESDWNAGWGCAMPEELRQHLVDRRAAAGDSVVFRLIDGEAGLCEAWLESRAERDRQAVAARNQALADAARTVLRDAHSTDMLIWDLAVALLARGAFHADVAPDPLETVLAADSHFTQAGFEAWMLEENVTPALRLAIRRRQQNEARLFGPKSASALAVPDQPIPIRGNAPVPQRPGRERARPPHRRKRGQIGPAQVYQLKVTLKHIRPPIWRRLLVSSDTTLDQLHHVLQVGMGWLDEHLHQFVVDDVPYGDPDADWDTQLFDEHAVTLGQVASIGRHFLYEYDFGDGWEHDVLVEKVFEPKPGVTYPMCITGRRACPPEDVGGPWGYTDFLRILSDPQDPEYAERMEWAGGPFDPEEFDAQAVNSMLALQQELLQGS